MKENNLINYEESGEKLCVLMGSYEEQREESRCTEKVELIYLFI